MNGTVCTFGPHVPTVCTSYGPAAPWWATPTPLWVYLCVIAGLALVSWSASWMKDHYEIINGHLIRRWYGTGAWVTLRCDAGLYAPARWEVQAWSSDNTVLPWLLVSPVDDEDADAFWGAATDFAPHAIRLFSPYLWNGWLPVLFARETLPRGTS